MAMEFSSTVLSVAVENAQRRDEAVVPQSLSLQPASGDFIVTEREHIAQTDTERDRRRWRPSLHPMPCRGWLNDPCAPGYDPYHQVYHLGFQWNPDGVEWGNISWGAAISPDLVHWVVPEEPSMAPTATHDRDGVFTGCMRPTGPDGRTAGLITALYTSARRVPIHFTLPHVPDSELVCMATSADSGNTWNRDPGNVPVVSGPPADLDVVGWRDPYVAPWPTVHRLLGAAVSAGDGNTGTDNTLLYGILSGGIRNQSPTTFLYRINGSHLDCWEYIGPLLCPGLNFSPSPRWASDFGINWEVTNFLPLQDPETGLAGDFLICGVEGRKASPSDIDVKGEFRATHGQMWLRGTLQSRPHHTRLQDGGRRQEVEMVYQYGGALDHGALYAANSFWDPRTRQHIMFGWVLEEDLPLELRRRQGWAGTLSFPRVLQLGVLRSVVGALVTPLRDIGTIGVTPADGPSTSVTVTTLCVRPDPRLERLRCKMGALSTDSLVSIKPGLWSVLLPQPCAQFELKVSWQVSQASQRLGFRMFHSTDESTAAYFDPFAEQVVIDRSFSTRIPGVAKFNETAPHTLFSFADVSKDSSGNHTVSREELSFHVYFDHGVMEVFVNERTAITTRVYPSKATCQEIQPFLCANDSPAAADSSQSRLVRLDFWPLALL